MSEAVKPGTPLHESINHSEKFASVTDNYIQLYRIHENNEVVCELMGIPITEGLRMLANKRVFAALAGHGCYMNSEELYSLLSDSEQAFINEYMVDFDASKAAKRAGYLTNPAKSGRALLNSGTIRFIIMCRQQELRDVSQVTAQAVLHELSKIGFANIGDYVEFDNNVVTLRDSKDVDTSAISEVHSTQYGVKIKLYSKQAALESIGKHLGMFKEKVEITGKDGGPLEINHNISLLKDKVDGIVSKVMNAINDKSAEIVKEAAETIGGIDKAESDKKEENN